MLLRFRVNNFKSLVNAEFRPAGINLLVGANNAGKTNLCQALRFLSLTASKPLDDAARECTAEPWNLVNVHSKDRTIRLEVECELPLESSDSGQFAYELEVRELGYPGTRTLLLKRERLTAGIGSQVEYVLLDNEGVPYHEATELFQTWNHGDERVAAFKRYLTSWAYHDLQPTNLRSNSARPMDHVLKADASNLCSVLFTLHNERPRDERLLVETVRTVEPKLDLFSYQSPDPDHAYVFFEDAQGNRFGVHSLSDGTIRYLAMAFVILSSRRENGATPLIVIEEAENGIFVGNLKSLFEKIDPSGRQGQFIFTSHNPYFIDLFDGSLDGLHVVKQDGSSTRIVKPDESRLADLLGKFSLGEMHFRGLLE